MKKIILLFTIFFLSICLYAQTNSSITIKANVPGTGEVTGGFTLNGNAYILVASKDSNNYNLYLYDAVNDTFYTKAKCQAPSYQNDRLRYGIKSFALNNKGYFGFGFSNGSGTNPWFHSFNDIWEYNPVLNNWTSKNPFSGSGVFVPSIIPLAKKVLVVGGVEPRRTGGLGYPAFDYHPKEVYEFYPDSNSWTRLNDIPDSLNFLQGPTSWINNYTMPNGTITLSKPFNKTIQYNLLNDSWSNFNSNIDPLNKGAYAFTINGKPYFNNGFLLDFSASKWIGKSGVEGIFCDFTFNQNGYFFGRPTKAYNPQWDAFSSFAISNSSTCQLYINQVTFTLYDDFNFQSNNKFIIQFSNNNFQNYFSVDSNQSVNNKIIFKVPRSILPGVYKLRLISTNPQITNDINVNTTILRAPTIGPIGGLQAIVDMAIPVQYNVSQQDTNHTYFWSVEGGNLVSGQGKNLVLVQWLVKGGGNLMAIKYNLQNCTDTARLLVTIGGVGLVEANKKMQISIYPNPANQSITISSVNQTLMGSSISIVDILGRLIKTEQIKTNGNVEMNISELSLGTYIVEIIKEGNISRTKLVKE